MFSADSESSMDRLCICTLWTMHLLTSHCPWLTSHSWKALFLFNFLWEQNIWYVGFCECNCETFGIWWCCKKQKDYYLCKETEVRIKKTGERDDNKKENKGKSVCVCVDEFFGVFFKVYVCSSTACSYKYIIFWANTDVSLYANTLYPCALFPLI